MTTRDWNSIQAESNVKKKKKQKNRKDTITPNLRNPQDVEELQWLWKQELKKRGLKGA